MCHVIHDTMTGTESNLFYRLCRSAAGLVWVDVSKLLWEGADTRVFCCEIYEGFWGSPKGGVECLWWWLRWDGVSAHFRGRCGEMVKVSVALIR